MFRTGTCLKEVSSNGLIWFSMMVYMSIRIYSRSIDDVPNFAYLMDAARVEVLGGFLSFFLVLFVNQTNGRFLEMYGCSKACSGRIQDIAGLARCQLPPVVADRLIRHMNAAQVAGYVGLNAIGQGSPYSKAHFFWHYNGQYKLLTFEEMLVLDRSHDMDHSSLCMKELITWCQQDVSMARKAGYIDSVQEQNMHDIILECRAAIDGMYDYTDQPPHFFYIHFLVLLSAIYLPLFAVDTAFKAGWGDTYIGVDLISGLVVFLQCTFVVGLRSLGTKMIDPYGDDLEDLSVINYVEGTLENCSGIMRSRKTDFAFNTKLQEAVLT